MIRNLFLEPRRLKVKIIFVKTVLMIEILMIVIIILIVIVVLIIMIIFTAQMVMKLIEEKYHINQYVCDYQWRVDENRTNYKTNCTFD